MNNSTFKKFILSTFNEKELMKIENPEFPNQTPVWFRHKISKKIVTEFFYEIYGNEIWQLIFDYAGRHDIDLITFLQFDPLELLEGEKINNRTVLIINYAWLAAQIVLREIANEE